LNAVIDPATGMGLADAGLVKGLVVERGRAGFVIEAPADRVAAYAPVRDQAEGVLKALTGIDRAHVVLTAEQPTARSRGASLSKAALDQGRPKAPVATDRPEHVRRVIAVASGKGGVGKSTVAANLAVALAGRGLRAGLLDADVYGPSAPLMLGLSGSPQHDGERLVPLEAHGVKAMSTGLLVGADQAMVWRGPMASQALTQMLTQTRWGTADEPLDVLVVDLPPGTGDVQLTLVQKTPIDGVIIVSTPQEAALADARRAVAMFGKTGTPVMGLVENMSGPVFGEGGAEREAGRLGVRFLGSVPLEAGVREGGDSGRPVVLDDPHGEAAKALAALADVIAG
jgi:ATP-binding protein involved in chromosome partitioning